MIETQLPVVCSFHELQMALAPLHQFEKAWLDSLHDIWRRGSPSPESQLLQPQLFDERKSDEFNHKNGNHMRRLIHATMLVKWLQECAFVRGIYVDTDTAGQIINGQYQVVGNYDDGRRDTTQH